jgi:hypothetical protein
MLPPNTSKERQQAVSSIPHRVPAVVATYTKAPISPPIGYLHPNRGCLVLTSRPHASCISTHASPFPSMQLPTPNDRPLVHSISRPMDYHLPHISPLPPDQTQKTDDRPSHPSGTCVPMPHPQRPTYPLSCLNECAPKEWPKGPLVQSTSRPGTRWSPQ